MTERIPLVVRLAVWLLLAVIVSAPAAWAQAPPPKPKPKPKTDGEPTARSRPVEQKVAATLLILSDESCELTVNGKAVGRLEAGSSQVVPLDVLGKQLVQATAADGTIWRSIVAIEKSGQEIVQVGLADVRAEQASDAGQRAGLVARGGLTWTPRDNGSDVNWLQAGTYCADLRLGGHSDWRLPTVDELETLYDDDRPSKYLVVDTIQLLDCCPWSGTKRDDASAWVFNFMTGSRNFIDLDVAEGMRVFCVRGRGRQ